jgi:phage terminase small subunit
MTTKKKAAPKKAAPKKKAVKKPGGGSQLNNAGLTDKQEKFCQFYLVELNATKAARQAGYSLNSAHEIGYENLLKPDIQKRIEVLRADMAISHNVTKERIAKEYARLAYLDPRNLYHPNGTRKAIHELDDDTAAAINSIEMELESYLDDDLNIAYRYVAKKIKMVDKKGALDSMVKLYGFAAPDKISPVNPDGSALNFVPPTINVTVVPSPKDDD